MATGTPRGVHGWTLLVGLVAVAGLSVGLVACGSSSKTATDTTESSAAGSGTTDTTAGPSAADDLAPFFAASVEVDQKLQVAADAVNARIGADTVSFDQATRDAIAASSPDAVAATIPAGMGPELEQAVLLVYSDLVSRFQSLNDRLCVTEEPYPRSELDPRCFAAGHVAAGRFDADLAAARAAAAAAPPVVVAASDSRAAAELALRIYWTDLANGCAAGGGGYLATKPIVVVWKSEPQVGGGPPWDGRADDLPFRATYAAPTGWKIELNAC